jgi:hypothetical protein
VIVPELERRLGPAVQGRFPTGFRIVDPSAAIAAQGVWKAVDLDFALSALGSVIDQLHYRLHQLLGSALRRLVKFLHHRLLLFFVLAHAAQFLGRLRRLAFGHPTLEIRGGKCPGPRAGRLRRAAIG